ncbi:mobilization protein [uncultured Shewanella sp.]|uniref:mobilization protein n=1 Tax=uncultured Shewanella sp. TaxID=173975 RepID=UPI00260E5FA5|nr:mobilization protein [uncultured Shewanella sp.]
MTSQLEKLKEKQKQIQAQIKQVEAREKQKQRKEDTRRKIILGAMIMDAMKNSAQYREKIESDLNRYLTNERDRKLFNLSEES